MLLMLCVLCCANSLRRYLLLVILLSTSNACHVVFLEINLLCSFNKHSILFWLYSDFQFAILLTTLVLTTLVILVEQLVLFVCLDTHFELNDRWLKCMNSWIFGQLVHVDAV